MKRLSWIAWLLVLLLGFIGPAQAMNTALPDLSKISQTKGTAKTYHRSFPINFSDTSGLSYSSVALGYNLNQGCENGAANINVKVTWYNWLSILPNPAPGYYNSWIDDPKLTVTLEATNSKTSSPDVEWQTTENFDNARLLGVGTANFSYSVPFSNFSVYTYIRVVVSFTGSDANGKPVIPSGNGTGAWQAVLGKPPQNPPAPPNTEGP